MKILQLLISLLFSIIVFSQKQFEGTILYNLHAAGDKPDEDAELTVLFGKNAIILQFHEKKRLRDRNEILVRFDSARIYTLDLESKTFTSRKLREQPAVTEPLQGKNISGYQTRAIKAGNGSTLGDLAGMFRMKDIVFYVSDSLYYPIPEKYASHIELAFIHNGRIILSAEMKPPTWSMSDGDDEDAARRETRDNITVEAVKIKWEPFNENRFLIPPGYVKHQNNLYPSDSLFSMDSVAAVMTDSIMPAQPVEKKTVIASETKQKKPTTNKNQPVPKTNKTQPGTIRKPD